MESMLRIGVITSPHGVHGEVKVYPTTDDVKRFELLEEVYLDIKGNQKKVFIQGVKYFKNMVILKFKGLDNRNDIEGYRNVDILIDRKDAIPLEEGEFFICDILGFDIVEDNGNRLGVLDDVLQTGANDVYVVKTDEGKEILLPAIKECILDTDVEKRVIYVHVMKGLID